MRFMAVAPVLVQAIGSLVGGGGGASRITGESLLAGSNADAARLAQAAPELVELIDPGPAAGQMARMLSGETGYLDTQHPDRLTRRLGRLPDEMVRIALRAGLLARRRQLQNVDAPLPPVPPPGSPEEEAELLQGLLEITPDWHQQVSHMESGGHQAQLAKVKAAEAALKRSKKGGGRAAVAKELAEAAEGRGGGEEGAQQQPKSGGGSNSNGAGGGFGAKAKGARGGGKGGRAKGFGKR